MGHAVMSQTPMLRTDGPIGIKISAFNYRLWNRRRAIGLTLIQFAQVVGIGANRYHRIELLKTRPTAEEMDEIASALDADPSDLFPQEVLDAVIPGAPTTVRIGVSAAAAGRLFDYEQPIPQLESVDARVGLMQALEQSMECLTDIQRSVVTRRFPLDGTEPDTRNAIAEDLGVSTAYIQQVEYRALEKMRIGRANIYASRLWQWVRQ